MPTVMEGLFSRLRALVVIGPLLGYAGTCCADPDDPIQVAGFMGYGVDQHAGLEIGLGLGGSIKKTSTSLVVYSLQTLVYCKDSQYGYNEDSSSVGRSLCSDLLDGKTPDSENNSSALKAEYAPSAELIQKVVGIFSIGAGFRGGHDPGAYGAMFFEVDDGVYMGLRGGQHYAGLTFGGYF